ncbi:uracil DNA glycosylase [secondary endosymbiont of Heteropsylla cubana]|uniref:Uracil DNA glycosylase n=1 Tax=secondary endosymbiont of Heteropsylla cubana TaxID=134287 RepID=J3Z644_9ENTR|nr:uracil DNA glycosylase [secondary endosymbiont of Heteropsylla cubana]
MMINQKHHYVLKASHPSPLSVYHSFFGCRHFSKTNMLLENQGKTPIIWTPKVSSVYSPINLKKIKPEI